MQRPANIRVSPMTLTKALAARAEAIAFLSSLEDPIGSIRSVVRNSVGQADFACLRRGK